MGRLLSSDQIKPAAIEQYKQNVIVHALSMAFGTLSSRVLGLVREIAFAALFDRMVTDAWTAAFRLPNLFRRLLGEGSLSVSFIPVFVETRLQGEESAKLRAHNLVNGVYTLLLILLAALTLLGIYFSEPILKLLLDESYVAISSKFDLTVRFARIMFGFVFLICTYAYFMAILNALGKFALAAMAPALFNVAMIISTLLPTNWFPRIGDGLAWGVLVGGLLQIVILVPSLIRAGYFPKVSFQFNNPDIYRVLKNMGPGLMGLGLMQIATLVNMRYASALSEGSISYIYWADRLIELPLSLISVSLGTALLPALSSLWSQNQKEKMSETMNYYLRLNIFVALPCALALLFLAEPLVRLIFERGKFNYDDVLGTAQVVQIYGLILLPTSAVRVLAPAYYSIKNTWLPAMISGVCLIIHILIAPLLMQRWSLVGLNLSSFISSSLNFILLFSLYRSFIHPLHYNKIFIQLGKYLIPGAFSCGVMCLYSWQIYPQLNSFFGQLVGLVVTLTLSMLVYLGMSRILNLEEYHTTVTRLLKKLGSKF